MTEKMTNTITASAFIYGAALFSGFSYLVGFWMPFKFNIFEHIDILDLLRVSVLPLVPIVVTTAISSGVGGLIGAWAAGRDLVADDTFGPEVDRSGLMRWILTLGMLLLIVAGLPDILFGEAWERVKGAFPVASLMAVVWLGKERRFLEGVPVVPRTVLIVVVCTMPLGAMNIGFSSGQTALRNNSDGYYVAGAKDCNSSDGEFFRYLSVIGGKVFSLSTKDGSICVTPADSFRIVRFSPEKMDAPKGYFQEWWDKWPSVTDSPKE